MTALTPGVYDIPAKQYHADPCPEPSLSASIGWEIINRSPAHAREKHPRLNPDFQSEHKAVFDLGSAAHNMVLRQNVWREEIAVVDATDWRTKAAREARDTARDAGRYPVLQEQYDSLDRMVSVLESHPQAGRAFTDGKPERSFIWRDKETGVYMRCRPDWTPDEPANPFPDYKTTQDANPAKWDRRFLLDHGGCLRAAFYEDGIRQACGVSKPALYYVVQEVAPPYCVIVRVVDEEILRIGRAMLRKAIHTWAECLNADKWPAYPLVGALALPGWADNQWSVEYADWMPKQAAPALEEIAP